MSVTWGNTRKQQWERDLVARQREWERRECRRQQDHDRRMLGAAAWALGISVVLWAGLWWAFVR